MIVNPLINIKINKKRLVNVYVLINLFSYVSRNMADCKTNCVNIINKIQMNANGIKKYKYIWSKINDVEPICL